MTEVNDSTYQSNWSFGLIVAILIVLLLYMLCTFADENEQILQIVIAFPIITLLVGGYTFTYKGKEYVISRIIFYIFLVLSLISTLGYMYIIELGKAFVH